MIYYIIALVAGGTVAYHVNDIVPGNSAAIAISWVTWAIFCTVIYSLGDWE